MTERVGWWRRHPALTAFVLALATCVALAGFVGFGFILLWNHERQDAESKAHSQAK